MLVAAGALAVADVASARGTGVRESHQLLGALVEVRIEGVAAEDASRLAREAVALGRQIEAELSTFDQGSPTSRLNRRAGAPPAPVPTHLYRLLLLSRVLARSTGGAFDVTVGPLLAAGGRQEGRVEQALALVGADKIVTEPPSSAALAVAGMAVDFGAIARGYVLGGMAEHLRRAGVRSALLSFAGDCYVAVGRPPERRPWRVPVARGRTTAGVVSLRDRALAITRTLSRDDRSGRIESTTVDPRSGRWVTMDRQAVAVAFDAAIAEAWSTAAVVDPRATLEFLDSPRGVEALVFDEYGEHRSRDFRDATKWKAAGARRANASASISGSAATPPGVPATEAVERNATRKRDERGHRKRR